MVLKIKKTLPSFRRGYRVESKYILRISFDLFDIPKNRAKHKNIAVNDPK